MHTSTSPLAMSQEVHVAMALAQLRQRCENRPTSMIFDSHGFQAGGESHHFVDRSFYTEKKTFLYAPFVLTVKHAMPA